jgi:hypothetical protein
MLYVLKEQSWISVEDKLEWPNGTLIGTDVKDFDSVRSVKLFMQGGIVYIECHRCLKFQ